jgi:hypothetical protein
MRVEKKTVMEAIPTAGPNFGGLSDLIDRSQQRSAIGGSRRAGYMER